ncbi:hypothetical protein SEPCBS57363_001561 [Sporothrix epigloea]|uniref:Uncharacterized protein n=1 Tax=Sporothrix epigloea TaxID=1892477 RepID=A0ABP0DET2_9PEZI
MIVAPPRINLRRAASYTHDKGPQSSTSSRFGFEHLLFASPPPSPGLPQLLPRKKKASHIPRPRRVLRVVVYVLGLVSALYLSCVVLFGNSTNARTIRSGFYIWPTEVDTGPRADDTDRGYNTIARSKLPGHPTPVIVSDEHGKAKWTVSIPPNAKFPLATDEYTSICDKCLDVANRVDILRGKSSGGISSISIGGIPGINKKSQTSKSATERLHTFDNNFIDVHEAEEAGYLTGSVSIATLINQQSNNNDDGKIVGEEDMSSAQRAKKPVCGRSLTFVLASADAGLGRTLMLLWMAYAQAQVEGREFFIDDTRWAYGRYTQIFAPPPSPECRPPLRHEMLPCPHQARHLVMTIDTASRFILAEEDDGVEGVAPERTAHLFDLARKGCEALFHLNLDDAKHVAKRVKQIQAEAVLAEHGADADLSTERGAIVGVHVRRGDRRPAEFQYRDSYLPLNLYADRAAGEIAASTHVRRKSAFPSPLPALMVLATDDPMVYQSEEFASATRAQKHIRLANKAATEPPVSQRGALRKFVDEAFGWEGGFYAAMFWNLGGAAPPTPDAVPMAAEALRIRSLVGRAYMMDLAVLAEASDSVVCAVSATGCRLLAVMMGRDKAFKQGRWINIDGEYGWWAVDF